MKTVYEVWIKTERKNELWSTGYELSHAADSIEYLTKRGEYCWIQEIKENNINE